MRYQTLPSRTILWTLLAIGIVLIIGALNYYVNSELLFSVFYLAPIFLACRKAGFRASFLVSSLSTLVWLMTDLYYLDREYRYFFTPYWNALVIGAFFMIVVVIYDRWDQEWRRARQDKVTGLPNRLAFLEQAKLTLNLCRRYAHSVSLAYLDVDDFKRVNQRLGRDAGDEALRQIAGALSAHLRVTDIIAHMGSDEFAILMPETAPQSAEKSLRRIVTELCLRKDLYAGLGFSVGFATFASPNVPLEEMLSKADLLMHEAKQAGKNRFYCAAAS